MTMFLVNLARIFSSVGVLLYTIGFSMVLPMTQPGEDIFFGFKNLGVGPGLAFELAGILILGTAASKQDKSSSGLIGGLFDLLGALGALIAFVVFAMVFVFEIGVTLLLVVFSIADNPTQTLLTYVSFAVFFYVSVAGFDRIYRIIFPKRMEGML